MSEFTLEILTPGRTLVKAEVSEVVVPGFNGECGILAGHENFVSLLGTGALKLVRDGDDYWFMVSSGVFEVRDGAVSVLADVAEEVSEISADSERQRLEELEPRLDAISVESKEHSRLKIDADRARARLEVHRRTQLN